MTNNLFFKFSAVIIAVSFLFSIVHPLEAVELKVSIPFGHGSNPKKDDTIERLKNEKTQGAGTVIALVLLGACIVAAAIIIANKADDIANKANDKTDELTKKAEDTYQDYKDTTTTTTDEPAPADPVTEDAPAE